MYVLVLALLVRYRAPPANFVAVRDIRLPQLFRNCLLGEFKKRPVRLVAYCLLVETQDPE